MEHTSPIIHLNGTGSKDLLAETEFAVDAMRKALRALEAMTVHGRDYFDQADYRDARQAHLDRIQTMRRAIQELECRWSDIVDQVDARCQPTGT